MFRRGRASIRPIVGAVGIVATVLAGCASGDEAASETSAASESSKSTTTVTTTSRPSPSPSPSPSPTTTTTPKTAPLPTVNETIATVPEEAAPGIDSEDPFCRAWSEFAGSFQALTFASIDAADPLVGARLEVVAAGAVVEAARSLDDAFPDEIADEREVFVGDVIGPFARRAARAADELRSAGVGAGDIELLREAWLAALVASDPADPVTTVDIPPELDAAIDAASAAFAADVPPIVDDPSLITSAEAPDTLGYLAEQCPDQGILAGNDAID